MSSPELLRPPAGTIPVSLSGTALIGAFERHALVVQQSDIGDHTGDIDQQIADGLALTRSHDELVELICGPYHKQRIEVHARESVDPPITAWDSHWNGVVSELKLRGTPEVARGKIVSLFPSLRNPQLILAPNRRPRWRHISEYVIDVVNSQGQPLVDIHLID